MKTVNGVYISAKIFTDTIELNDDAPESKLLGIQVDIDLEDKNKSTGDIQ